VESSLINSSIRGLKVAVGENGENWGISERKVLIIIEDCCSFIMQIESEEIFRDEPEKLVKDND
jgi:hypothetical protein